MEGCNDIISNNPKTPTNENSYFSDSLLEREELFFNRLISRDSSKGLSSRIYYQVPGKVPFDWELHPGKPKNPRKSEPIPPLSPPPAVLSSRLSPLLSNHQTKVSKRWRTMFWNKNMKKSQRSQSQTGRGSKDGGVDRVESHGFWSCEGDMASSARNSSSSLSSSFGSSLMTVDFPRPTNQTRMVTCHDKMRVMDGSDENKGFTMWRLSGVFVCMHG